MIVLDAPGHVLRWDNVRKQGGRAEETPETKELEVHKVECPEADKAHLEGIIPILPSVRQTQGVQTIVMHDHIQEYNQRHCPERLLPFDTRGIGTNRIN